MINDYFFRLIDKVDLVQCVSLKVKSFKVYEVNI